MSYFATSRDGTRIAYDRIGEGPAIILVGGAFQHRAAAPELTLLAQGLAARGFTVVNFDRRGRGESGDASIYNADREVEDLAALITDLGGEAMVFGHSSGGVLGLWAAVADIGVTRLAMFEPPIRPGGTREDELAQLQALSAANDREGLVRYFMKDMPPEWLVAAQVSPAWAAMQAVAPTLVYEETLVAKLQERPLAEALAPITLPVLAMVGEITIPFMEASMAALRHALPHAEVHVIAARDHRWSPDGMTIRLADFFGA